jgi:hypothetical protein
MYDTIKWFVNSDFKKKLYRTLLLFIIVYITLRFYYKYNTKSVSDNILIDVRTKTEWDIKHNPNAIHIPYTKIDKLKADKNKEITLFCSTGRRASIAKKTLEDLGYTNVKVSKYP